MRPIDAEAARELAEYLPDDPFTFDARSCLFRGFAEAWILGEAHRFRAAIVRDRWQPTEPRAFGEDAVGIWMLLKEVPNWNCVNCSSSVAPALRELMEGALGQSAETLEDIYFVLHSPAVRNDHPSVRRLSEEDLGLVERAPSVLHPVGYDSTLAALSGGILAGAVEGGQLVALVSMTWTSETYANLAAHTLEGWRRQGMAAAGAYLVASAAQERGLIPVWSAGANNRSSQRVAQKLGFGEYGRRAYVIVPGLPRGSGFRPTR